LSIKNVRIRKIACLPNGQQFNIEIKRDVLSNLKIDRISRDQLRRAAMSIMLNIAEGTSRFSNAAERNYYIIARGSTFECVSILDLLLAEKIITLIHYNYFYSKAEEISKMLFSMIMKLKKQT
jgi:four helix bundle protein